MTKPGKPSADKRTHVLHLLRLGYITQSEAAGVLGVSRQRIHQWVAAERIYPVAARLKHIRKLLNNDHDLRVQL